MLSYMIREMFLEGPMKTSTEKRTKSTDYLKLSVSQSFGMILGNSLDETDEFFVQKAIPEIFKKHI